MEESSMILREDVTEVVAYVEMVSVQGMMEYSDFNHVVGETA